MQIDYSLTIPDILKDGSYHCVVVMLNAVASTWLTDMNTLYGRPDHNFYNFLQKVLNYKLEASGRRVTKLRPKLDALSTDKLNDHLAKDAELRSNFIKNALDDENLKALLFEEKPKARELYPYLILLLNLAIRVFCALVPSSCCPQIFFGQRALQEARRVDIKFKNAKDRWICFVSVYREEMYLEPCAIGAMQQKELMEEEDSSMPQGEEFKDALRTTTSREASPKVKVEEQMIQQTKRLDTANQPSFCLFNQEASRNFISPAKTTVVNFSTGASYRGLEAKREDEEKNSYLNFQASTEPARFQKYGDLDSMTKENKTRSQSLELLQGISPNSPTSITHLTEEIFTNESGDDNFYGTCNFMMREKTRISKNSFFAPMETIEFLDYSEANFKATQKDYFD